MAKIVLFVVRMGVVQLVLNICDRVRSRRSNAMRKFSCEAGSLNDCCCRTSIASVRALPGRSDSARIQSCMPVSSWYSSARPSL